MRRRLRNPQFCRNALTSSAAWAAVALLACTSAKAWTFKTLHSFCAEANCADGTEPGGNLLLDGRGNLYGTTYGGGTAHDGTIFQLTFSTEEQKWKFRRIYSFCSKLNCADGIGPNGSLIIDLAGALYGTTQASGSDGSGPGIAFKLTAEGRRWKLKSHVFRRSGYFDGPLSYAGQAMGELYDGTSPLYGTMFYGPDGGGSVYRVSIEPAGRWRKKILYRFCSQVDCYDGLNPIDGVVVDGVGNLFGNTFRGGSGGEGGVVYKVSMEGKKWSETVLCAFPLDCEGNQPDGLVLSGMSDLFGVTASGGAAGDGVAFRLATDGSGYTKLYDFCTQTNCADGSGPQPGISMDAAGNLYGTTLTGGTHNAGVVYRLTPGAPWQETILYSFCSQKNCRDGSTPPYGVIVDANGNLYGITQRSGKYGGGTVFELSP